MVMHRISPQLLHVSVILVIALPLSFLVLKLKRLGSKRNPPPTNNHYEIETPKQEASSFTSVSSLRESSSWWEYQVFLSFRGSETRKKFVSHLHQKLKDKGINVFKDDVEFPRGDDISRILEAIEKSRTAIVVLSKDFASSTFCLDEIVKIIDCKEKKGQIVLPIFYELDPSDVEEHKGTIAEKYKGMDYDTTTIQRWGEALSTVAKIAGWVSLELFDGVEANLINHIYESVEKILACTPSSTHRSDLVDMDHHMREIDGRLNVACDDKRMIGIWGLGGIGKTTIAEVICNKYACQFESHCFLQNVKDDYEIKGVTYLQKKLLDQALNGFNQDVRCQADGCNVIHQRLHLKRVLVILDDVDNFKQLNALAGSLDWFGDRSRVIITTRNGQLLEPQGLQHVYKVQYLNSDMARKLFEIHAFGLDQTQKGYGNLINDFVTYAGGLPLALVVLGRSLRGLNVEECESQLSQSRCSGDPEINEVLRLSYDRLANNVVKGIFLDIAFFFKGWKKDRVIDILERDGCFPRSAIRVLELKALLTIDKYHRLQMHDLIQDMAREIVKEESNLCEERSRLSGPRDVASMLRSRKVKSRIQGISLRDMSKIQEPIHLDSKAFDEMSHLRILDFRVPWKYRDKQAFQLDQDIIGDISEELMYFRWDSFPFINWPSTFIAQNLVELRLRWSKLKCLWNTEMELGKLKVIDLAYSKSLQKFPNLSKAPKVETMLLRGCESLSKFSSDFKHLEMIDRLDFSGCKRLDNLPLLPPNLTELDLPKIAITKLFSHFESLTKLDRLYIGDYGEFTFFSAEVSETTSLSEPVIDAVSMEDYKLSNSFGKLKSLNSLSLIGISITELPQSIEHLEELTALTLYQCTKLVRLSSNIHKLTKLWRLEIKRCKRLCSLPQLPESLGYLTADFCEALKTLEGDGSWDRLQELERVSFIDCKGLDHSACTNNLEHMIKGRMEDYNRWIYPGKEIPRWFEYRSEGSSITIQLTSRPFLRIAFCVVFAVDQYSPDPNYLCRHDEIDIKADSGHGCSSAYIISIQSEGVDDNILFNFYAYNFYDKPVKEVKVKRCGVHIFTTDDKNNEDTYESEEEDVTGDEESCESDEEDVAANKCLSSIAQDEIKRKMDEASSSTNVKQLKRSH